MTPTFPRATIFHGTVSPMPDPNTDDVRRFKLAASQPNPAGNRAQRRRDKALARRATLHA